MCILDVCGSQAEWLSASIVAISIIIFLAVGILATGR